MVVWMAFANSVFAHAQCVKCNPPDKADLKQAPSQVDIWFDELLEDGFNSAECFPASDLTAKKRVNYIKSEPKVDEKDRTHLVTQLRPLKPGKYVFQYRVLSRDGHVAPGQLTFQVLP